MAKRIIVVLFIFLFYIGFTSIQTRIQKDNGLPQKGNPIFTIIKNEHPGFPAENGKNTLIEKYDKTEIPVVLETKFEKVSKGNNIVTLTKTMETKELTGTDAVSYWKYRIQQDSVELIQSQESGVIGDPQKKPLKELSE